MLRSLIPDSLQQTAFLLQHWQWLGLAALAALGFVVSRLVRAVGRSLVTRLLRRRLESLEPGLLKRAVKPLGLLAAALVWMVALSWLDLPSQAFEIAWLAVRFTAAAAVVWSAYRLIDVLAALFEQRAQRTGHTLDDLLVPLVRKSLKLVVTAFGLVFVADALDLPIRSLLAGLGIGGLAVALAAQDAVKNFFGSLLVIMDQPFSVGDYVTVGSIEGTVEELGFRSTRIRTPQDSIVTLPNSHLITSSVDNLGHRRTRRWKTTLGLTCDTPPDKIEAFCDGVRELIREHPHTVKEGFQVAFNEFSASSLDVVMLVKFDVPDWGSELAARQRLGLGILRLAEDLGVETAFPTQTVHVHGAVAGAQ